MALSCGSAVRDAVSGINAPCMSASDYSFLAIEQTPTPQQINRLCSSPQCSQVIAAIRKAVPNECAMETKNHGAVALYKDILDPIASVCSKGPVALPNPTWLVVSMMPMPAARPWCQTQVSNAASSVGPQCMADSGYSFMAMTDKPSREAIDKICASKSCAETIAAIKNVMSSECAMRNMHDDIMNLYTDILGPIDFACKGSNASSQGSNAKEVSATVTTAPPLALNKTTTTVPSPTTTKSPAAARRRAVAHAVAAAVVAALVVVVQG